MKRILLVAAANSTTGGGERHVADLLRELPAAGIEPALVCPAGGDLTSLAESLGIPAYCAPIASGLTPAGVAGVRAAIRSFSPDLVHAHGSRAAFFARLADARARARCVYTVHGIHIDKAGSAVRRAVFLGIERVLRPRTARFICVCASDAQKGARLGILSHERTSVVHNGIGPLAPLLLGGAFRTELALSEDRPLVVSVGRMHEQKDHRTLLDAWRVVIDQVPEAVLALVGGGELEGALRERALALELGESMRFVAPRPDLASVYADADVFALSSLWEGLPYVVLEAMSAGLPIVSTSVDGIPEAVTDGECGVLVPPADPAALAEALLRVISDTAAARAMGEAGATRVVRDFSLEAMVAGTVEAYASALGPEAEDSR
jgi:glycosyltransferase involved in cell wall biosynthesis